MNVIDSNAFEYDVVRFTLFGIMFWGSGGAILNNTSASPCCRTVLLCSCGLFVDQSRAPEARRDSAFSAVVQSALYHILAPSADRNVQYLSQNGA